MLLGGLSYMAPCQETAKKAAKKAGQEALAELLIEQQS